MDWLSPLPGMVDRTPKIRCMKDAAELDLERIAELVIGIDRLARDIPAALKELKSSEGLAVARRLPMLSEALRLAISLDTPPVQLAADAAQLEDCFRRLYRLSLGSRLSATSKAGLGLGVSLAARLASELAQGHHPV